MGRRVLGAGRALLGCLHLFCTVRAAAYLLVDARPGAMKHKRPYQSKFKLFRITSTIRLIQPSKNTSRSRA